MPDYKNGKIYKLWSPEGDEIYIGSTIQPLYKRFHHHKDARQCSSKILFEKYNDVKIELIESCSCDNKEQLTKKEGEYIRNNKCVNKEIAGRTKKEWREDNKEYKKEYDKEYLEKYREDNKDKIKENKKEYYKNNTDKIKEYRSQKITCDCGRTITLGNKAEHEKRKVHIDNCKLITP